MPKNVRDLDKLIVAKGFKKLPKVQEIVQSGHTEGHWGHSRTGGIQKENALKNDQGRMDIM